MIFSEKIYAALRKVPKGRVTTYKELAKAVHSKAYRAVGTAMKCNPNAPKVPCHRVISSDGSIGGYMGKMKGKMIKTKIAMLQKEGIEIKNNKILDFRKKLYKIKK
jgi:methylated-DNA-[protein]-cysteine S-methyltransferase